MGDCSLNHWHKHLQTNFFVRNTIPVSKNGVCALSGYMPLFTIHRIHVKFQGSDTCWPVEPTFLEDGNVVYLCPHPTICGNYVGYKSKNGLYKHTRAHAPDTNLPLPMFSFEQLANRSSSLTPHPQLHTVAELELESLPANPPGFGAMMLHPSPSLAGFLTAPHVAIHPAQAVSTHLSISSLLLNTISG